MRMNVRALAVPANSADTDARATALTAEGTESSKSNTSASAPAAAAFGRKSSRLPGTNSRLRRFGSGHLLIQLIVRLPETIRHCRRTDTGASPLRGVRPE